MKTKISILLLALVVSTSANAQFGGLSGLMGGGKSGGADIGVQVEEFNKDANLISKTVAFSLLQIVGALGDKSKIAEIKAVNESLSKSTNAGEIGSLSGSIIKNNSAAAEEILKSKDAKAKMESLSPEMQKKVAQSIFAVGVAALRMPGAIDKGKNIMQGVGTNPMNITKAITVKDGLSLFAEVLPKLPTLVSTGLQLMRDVNIEAGNPTVSATLSPVPGSFPEN